MCIDAEFSVQAFATYSGDKITVSFNTSDEANCVCQLDSGMQVMCKCNRTEVVAVLLLSIHTL